MKVFPGKSKILGVLQQHSLTLSEISKETGLKKATVFYHLKKLKGQVAYDENTRTYSVGISEELKNPILRCIGRGKTTSELLGSLREYAKKQNEHETLVKLVKSKQFEDKVMDILYLLHPLGLVTFRKKSHHFGMRDEKEELIWNLTWEACNLLGICYQCKEKIEDGNAVAHTIMLDDMGPGETHVNTYLHPRCVLDAEASTHSADYWLIHDDICDYCGLPLSLRNLRRILSGQNSMRIIHDLLSKHELASLNEYLKRQLVTEIKKEFGATPPDGVFGGELLFVEHLDIPINVKTGKIDEKSMDTISFPRHGKISYLDFLSQPILSDLEKLYELIERGANYLGIKLESIEIRTKEIMHEWLVQTRAKEEQVQRLLATLNGDIRSEIYPNVDSSPPTDGTASSREFVIRYGYEHLQFSEGYSFIKRVHGKDYHQSCYVKFTSEQAQLEVGENMSVYKGLV